MSACHIICFIFVCSKNGNNSASLLMALTTYSIYVRGFASKYIKIWLRLMIQGSSVVILEWFNDPKLDGARYQKGAHWFPMFSDMRDPCRNPVTYLSMNSPKLLLDTFLVLVDGLHAFNGSSKLSSQRGFVWKQGSLNQWVINIHMAIRIKKLVSCLYITIS